MALARAHRGAHRAVRTSLVVLVTGLVLSACAGDAGGQGANTDPDQVDAVKAPELGACRELTPEDAAEPTNATTVVDCANAHTAQTFAVGQLPAELDAVDYDDEALGDFAYDICGKKFMSFLGADESLVMRTTVSWAWFRPSAKAWDEGARWYRCDIVGGGDTSQGYVELPETAEGLLLKQPDEWLVCVNGPSINSAKIPCSEPHTWRAVTTIKLGEKGDDYPGDRLVEVKSRDFCSESVGAWLNYPIDYDFAYTFFHEAEWEAGNRRSVCWAKTEQ